MGAAELRVTLSSAPAGRTKNGRPTTGQAPPTAEADAARENHHLLLLLSIDQSAQPGVNALDMGIKTKGLYNVFLEIRFLAQHHRTELAQR